MHVAMLTNWRFVDRYWGTPELYNYHGMHTKINPFIPRGIPCCGIHNAWLHCAMVCGNYPTNK